jgi:hypothetical protein
MNFAPRSSWHFSSVTPTIATSAWSTTKAVSATRCAGRATFCPFCGCEPSLPVLVEEIAQSRRRRSRYRAFDPSAGDFVTALLAALIDATEKRVLPIVLVDPKALARPEWLAAVASLLRHPWRGGVVVPVDASDVCSPHGGIKADLELTPNEREWIVVRVAQGGVAELRTALISVADDILARIVMHGSVERHPPATVGPVPLSARPRIANTLDTERVQP